MTPANMSEITGGRAERGRVTDVAYPLRWVGHSCPTRLDVLVGPFIRPRPDGRTSTSTHVGQEWPTYRVTRAKAFSLFGPFKPTGFTSVPSTNCSVGFATTTCPSDKPLATSNSVPRSRPSVTS